MQEEKPSKSFFQKYIANFYVISSLIFVTWMLVFDDNSLLARSGMKSKLKELKEEKAYYLELLSETKKSKEELLADPRNVEKFAREKHNFKRPNEDVFLVKE